MTCLPLKSGSTLTQRPAMFAIAMTVLAVLIGSSTRATAQCAGEGGNSLGFDMAPETSQRVVEDAVKQIPTPMAPGPVKPTWDSLKENYKVPELVQRSEIRNLHALRHILGAGAWQRVV